MIDYWFFNIKKCSS